MKLMMGNKAPHPPAILMAMRMHRSNWCGIARCSMSRANPKATGRYHQATNHSILSWQPPGRQSTNLRWKIHLLCWPFRWPSRCASTIACITRCRRSRAFLKATKRHHQASTCSNIINRTCLPLVFGVYFIVKLLKKGLSWPNNKRGMTHQYDEKLLSKKIRHLVGGLI